MKIIHHPYSAKEFIKKYRTTYQPTYQH